MVKDKEKGLVLILVLATIFVVTLLAQVILNIIASQAKLTHHQVSRIQAYYAGLAGVNYALEKLRVGDDQVNWPIPEADAFYSNTLCNGCTSGPGLIINEDSLPPSIQDVVITVAGSSTSGCNPPPGIPACVSATINYASQD